MNIISDLKKSGQDTFLFILNDHHSHVFRFYYKRFKDVEKAKELTQQCFIRLWEYRMSLSESITLERQLFAIAKSLMYNHLKKENAYSNLKNRFAKISITSTGEAPSSMFLAHHFEQRNFMNAAFNALPETQRHILHMKFTEGYTNKEIALQLSLSVKTVEWHINKAYHQLREVVLSI